MAGFTPAGPDNATDATYAGAGTYEEAVHELFSIVPEVNIEHLALTLLSAFIVLFGLFSGLIKERIFIGEAIIATLFGIAFSGYAAGIFAPRAWAEGHHFDDITLELTRIVIALSVFAVGVELPKAYVWRHIKSLSFLLGPVMLFGWMISAALMYAIIPGLEFLPALVVAAGVTPTDPILASSVVGKGKFAQEHVPAHIRHILQAESGSNDGAAFPFLYLAMFLLMRDHHSVGEAIGLWVALVVLYQIVLGIFIGAIVGIIARKLLKFSKRRELIDRESMVAMYVALALLVTGLTTLAGSDDLLAAFACGTAFAWDDWFTESIEESNFSSTVDLLANCAMFIYLGATMPFNAWNDERLTLTPWRLVLLAISILALRRLPSIFFLQYWIPDIKTRREAIFAGHFGPMGVGAIFISTLAASKLPTPNVPPENSMDVLALSIQPITYFLVLSSILIHGLTISFFSLGRRVHSRVTSITRTFTAASGDGNEPSWMSRVKRARAGEEIVINRDDDPSDMAEKGALTEKEEGDLGVLHMFGAPSTGTTDSTKSSVKADIERENDEDPPENVLEDHPPAERAKRRLGKSPAREGVIMEDEDEEPRKSMESAKEARYCVTGDTKTWKDGQKIIIDHNDGSEPEVIELDPNGEKHANTARIPDNAAVSISKQAIEAERAQLKGKKFESAEARDESAVKRAAYQMLRKASNAATRPFEDGLTAAEREEKHKRKLARDAWCRQERHYRDSGQKEWIEGDKVVIEGKAGEEATVRELTDNEKAQRAAKHLAALKALKLDGIEQEILKLTRSRSNEEDYFGPQKKDKGKGKAKAGKSSATSSPAASPLASPALAVPTPSPQPSPLGENPPQKPKNPGLSLHHSRTIRVSDDEDEASDEEEASEEERPVPSRRPSPPRRGTSINVMRQLFKRQTSTSPSPSRGRSDEVDGNDSRNTSPDRSRGIRFAAVDRPAREGSGVSTGRPLPIVGAGISARKPSESSTK
ncbi:Cation/H+ exchanger [Pseudohyphozyma bogoriensis]|nr:Cation/H+ exchanger [Pseudohyphozyma bogoriensis]